MTLGIRSIAVTLAVIAVGVFVGALVGPVLLDLLEASRGPLPFELALRWELLLAAVVWVASILLLWRVPRWLWIILVGVLVILGWIFIFDTHHELQKELSWIRYPTAGALFVASLLALLYSIRIRGWFWGLFTLGFLYAGADELLELHERIGGKLEAWFRLPHITTDLITVAYGIAGTVVTIIALRFLWKQKRIATGIILLAGITTFAVSQSLDTLDILLDPALRKLALLLAKRGYIFSDAWYFFYEPKRFANSLEEVLEFLAAMCFVLTILFLLSRIDRISLRERWNALTTRAWTLLTLLVFILLLGAIGIPSSSPVLGTSQSRQLGGPKDGLSHSDDLFFDPLFGVLLANEGGHTVLQWKDGKLTRITDPKRALGDMDSITAANGKIYVADGDAGKIFSSTGDGVWKVIADRSHGLKHPEGLVVVDDTIIGVDESERALFRLPLHPKEPVIEWYRPNSAGFTAPEGIAYDKERERLLVTDDKNGALWSIIFGQSAERLSLSKVSLKNPEDIEVLPNSDILLSDNGRGEVLRLTSDGTLKSRLQFRRMYRDVQGITTDTEDNLYIVTADGYASASFMPSFLWRVAESLDILL